MWDYLINLDKQLFLFLNGDWGSFADTIFFVASEKLTWVPLYLLLLYLVYRRYGLRQMFAYLILVVLIVAVADQICNFFKTFTPKFRPTHTPGIEELVHTVNNYRGGNYGTVSAHAATCFGIASFSALMLKNRTWTVVLYLWAALVAYSRIYLGVHFPMDIFFGTIVGISLGVISYEFYTNKFNKFFMKK